MEPAQQLAALDAAIAREPGRVELRYYRATLLAAHGRADEARADYLAVIAAEPTHFGALNDLGTLLHNTDFRTAARTVYAEAVRHHPDNPIGRINLANALLANDEIEAARAEYEAALTLAPDHPDAHQGLANLLQHEGRWEEAERHRQASYRARTVTHVPYRGTGAPCRVLLLVSGVGGNVPTRFILDDMLFATTIVVAEAFTETELPPHDVVFNAIGDADVCGAALNAAEAILKRTTAPMVNPPEHVRPTGRAGNAERLSGLPNVIAPRVIEVDRAEATTAAERIGYPLLVRSPGFHTGQHFRKVENAAGLAEACAALPTDRLLLIQYLDARDGQGRSRKYRVMMIGGRLYPLHLALSDDWKVHHFTADMEEHADRRAEEAAFLDDMAGVIGPKAMEALGHIQAALGLDYAGIDFGLAADGRLLLFETNATMVVNPAGKNRLWDYRRAPVERALDAAKSLVLQKDIARSSV